MARAIFWISICCLPVKVVTANGSRNSLSVILGCGKNAEGIVARIYQLAQGCQQVFCLTESPKLTGIGVVFSKQTAHLRYKRLTPRHILKKQLEVLDLVSKATSS